MPQTAGKGRPYEWEENDRRGTQAHPCRHCNARQVSKLPYEIDQVGLAAQPRYK